MGRTEAIQALIEAESAIVTDLSSRRNAAQQSIHMMEKEREAASEAHLEALAAIDGDLQVHEALHKAEALPQQELDDKKRDCGERRKAAIESTRLKDEAIVQRIQSIAQETNSTVVADLRVANHRLRTLREMAAKGT